MTGNPILSIGHSTHSIDTFLSLLERHSVTVVADVRSSPFSRHNPQFNRYELKSALKVAGIGYVFLGRELGARSDNLSDYKGNRVIYSRLAASEHFQSGISRVLAGSIEHRIALMCAEKEPLDCHRTILVAQALAKRGAVIEHILANGAIEHHDVTLERLVERVISPTADLFDQGSSSVADALLTREQQIAYVKRGEAA